MVYSSLVVGLIELLFEEDAPQGHRDHARYFVKWHDYQQTLE
jgi:hypothetical protein